MAQGALEMWTWGLGCFPSFGQEQSWGAKPAEEWEDILSIASGVWGSMLCQQQQSSAAQVFPSTPCVCVVIWLGLCGNLLDVWPG